MQRADEDLLDRWCLERTWCSGLPTIYMTRHAIRPASGTTKAAVSGAADIQRLTARLRCMTPAVDSPAMRAFSRIRIARGSTLRKHGCVAPLVRNRGFASGGGGTEAVVRHGTGPDGTAGVLDGLLAWSGTRWWAEQRLPGLRYRQPCKLKESA
jgi:hypothetical protein